MRDLRMSREAVLYELPMVEGFALKNWLIENDPWMNAVRSSDGYIAQERDRIKQKK